MGGNCGLISGAFSTQTAHTGTDLTTKGDLHGFSVTNTRVPISTDNFILTADSTESLGLKWAAPAIPSNIQYDVGTMSGVDFDFSSTNAIQTISISATTTFTGSNYAAGKTITLFITTDGSDRTLAFPAGWVFMGTKPTTQTASKVSTLTLTCTSTTEASVRCAYAVQE